LDEQGRVAETSLHLVVRQINWRKVQMKTSLCKEWARADAIKGSSESAVNQSHRYSLTK